jgi:hypothetical protein
MEVQEEVLVQPIPHQHLGQEAQEIVLQLAPLREIMVVVDLNHHLLQLEDF